MQKKATELNTIFMGTSSFADSILKTLINEKYNLISVYTQKDKKVGREQTFQKTAVKITAEENKLPVFSPDKFTEAEVEAIAKQKPDLIIVVAYGKILPKTILDLPIFGAINVHASLLPDYRGPSPIQNTLLDGKKVTGTTIMLMDTGIDTGSILSQKKLTINPDETITDLSSRLAQLSAELLVETIPNWIEKKIDAKPQDNCIATLCQLIERSDGKIIWSNDAQIIYNQYRAFYAWPGVFTYWQKTDDIKLRLKINKLALGETASNKTPDHKIGEVFTLNEKIAVQTGKGTILLEEVQIEGKNNLKINDFINGNQNFIGSILK